MGHKDKVRAVGKTPAAETAQEMPANNEREDNSGRGWSASMVGFITQKGHFKGVMNEGVKRKYLRQKRVWTLSFKYVKSGNSISAYPSWTATAKYADSSNEDQRTTN